MKLKSFALSTFFAITVCFSASCTKKNPNGSDSDFAGDGYGEGSAYGDGGANGGGAGSYSDFSNGNQCFLASIAS